MYDNFLSMVRLIKDNNPDMKILLTYHERGNIDFLFISNEKWGFSLKEVNLFEECDQDFILYAKKNPIFNDIYIFELIVNKQ